MSASSIAAAGGLAPRLPATAGNQHEHRATAGIDLSIVIPAYNEEGGIAAVLDRILQESERLRTAAPGCNVEVLVINDGSTDRTAEVVARCPAVTLVNCPRNRGYGAALQTGFRRAAGQSIAFLDADGTYPPEHLHVLYDTLVRTGADMVVGSRMMGTATRMPLVRKIGNWMFARLIGWSGTGRITDGGSGMRVFRRAVLPGLLPLSNGLDFIVGMSVRAIHERLHVVEVPIPYDERVGESKLRVSADGIRFLRTILRVGMGYNPLKFFVLAGSLLLIAAIILGLPSVWYYLQFRRVEDWEIYRLFTVMVLLVSGIEVAYFGLLATRVLALTDPSDAPPQPLGSVAGFLLDRRIFQLSVRFGVALVAGAAVLNYATIYEYARTGTIDVHWSYILTGATLVLIGVQLIMGGVLSKILEQVRERTRLRGSQPWR